MPPPMRPSPPQPRGAAESATPQRAQVGSEGVEEEEEVEAAGSCFFVLMRIIRQVEESKSVSGGDRRGTRSGVEVSCCCYLAKKERKNTASKKRLFGVDRYAHSFHYKYTNFDLLDTHEARSRSSSYSCTSIKIENDCLTVAFE